MLTATTQGSCWNWGSDPASQGEGLRFCISSQLSGKAEDAGLQTILQEAREAKEIGKGFVGPICWSTVLLCISISEEFVKTPCPSTSLEDQVSLVGSRF